MAQDFKHLRCVKQTEGEHLEELRKRIAAFDGIVKERKAHMYDLAR